MKSIVIFVVNLASIGLFAQGGNTKAERDSSSWDITALNTGASASYLSDVEKGVLLELNKVRSNPKLYAQLYISPMLGYFDGKLDKVHRIETNEGVKAVKDCIVQLEQTRKLDLFVPDKDLSKAALHHTSLQSKTKQTGHTSPNGETFQDRLKKVKFMSTGECISYGAAEARGIVIALLIDDGVPSRGHRRIILDPKFSAVGISAGKHAVYSAMCTLDFGGTPVRK